jgi:cation:H+ antiporter
MGNVVGSNVFNVLVILGICALITPLMVSIQVIKVEIPIMIGFSVLALIMAADGLISPLESMVLLGGLVGYTLLQAVLARNDTVREATPVPRGHVLLDIVFVLVGLAVLVFGARLLVAGAVTLAQAAGVGGEVIGLTIVAAGTSLPEVATSVAAVARGQRDIAIGNVIGSNIFNIVGVLGLSALFAPNGFAFDAVLNLPDFGVMLAAAALCLPIGISGLQISRGEGLLLLGAYLGYMALVVMRALDPSSAFAANAAILCVAIILPSVAVLLSMLERPLREAPVRKR